MIGFLSMNASDSPPFRILGNLVAVGMLIAYVYSMTLLPALLSVLPLRGRAARGGGSSFFDRLGAFVVARRTVLLWCVAAVAVALVAGVPPRRADGQLDHSSGQALRVPARYGTSSSRT